MFNRSGDGDKPHLGWRVRFFSAAAVLAMVGMAMSVEWLVWVAVLLLVLAFFLRFLPTGDRDGSDGSDGSADPRGSR